MDFKLSVREFLVIGIALFASPLWAQTAPDDTELAAYRGLHAATAKGDLTAIRRLLKNGVDINAADPHGRTPLMVAGYRRDTAAAALLTEGGANVNALDSQQYDLITIAAVANDLPMLKLAIAKRRRPNSRNQPL